LKAKLESAETGLKTATDQLATVQAALDALTKSSTDDKEALTSAKAAVDQQLADSLASNADLKKQMEQQLEAEKSSKVELETKLNAAVSDEKKLNSALAENAILKKTLQGNSKRLFLLRYISIFIFNL